MAEVVAGIDLGTTYSCIAAYVGDKVEILADPDGNRTIPSFVAFTDKEVQVGHSAKKNFLVDPGNRVYGKIFLKFHSLEAHKKIEFQMLSE
jgi:molecular chaperone DnaK (HSP70)